MLNDSDGGKKVVKELNEYVNKLLLWSADQFTNNLYLPRWLNPLFITGHKRKLEEDDMYKVLPEDSSEKLGEELQW